MKKLLFAIVLVASVILVSWTSHHKANSQNRPLKGAYNTTAQILSGPPLIQQQISGTGNLSHLGKSTFVAYSALNLTTAPPFSLGGNAVFTAANGDQFFTTFTGTATPNGSFNEVEMEHTITGGTGRFANATGTFTGNTVAYPGHTNGYITYDGNINY